MGAWFVAKRAARSGALSDLRMEAFAWRAWAQQSHNQKRLQDLVGTKDPFCILKNQPCLLCGDGRQGSCICGMICQQARHGVLPSADDDQESQPQTPPSSPDGVSKLLSDCFDEHALSP